MADSLDRLIRDAERLAVVADELSASFATELGRILTRIERAFPALLREALNTRQPTRLIEAARQLVLRAEIRRLLTDAGYDELAALAATRGLDDLARRVLETRTGKQAVEFASGIAQRIEGLQAMVGRDLLDEGDQVARALWKATLRGVIGQQDEREILSALQETLDKSDATVRTLYSTTVSIYTRQVEALQSTGEPDEAYLYSGPIDARVRPFCHEHVGKVFSRKAIDQMDNNQLPNVFVTGGGYNCRHTWMAVSKFSEVRDLMDTGERVPEMAAALARVKVERKAA